MGTQFNSQVIREEADIAEEVQGRMTRLNDQSIKKIVQSYF